MDEEPAEVLHLGLEGLRLEAALSGREQSFQLICEHLQLDSCVRTQPRMHVLTTAPSCLFTGEHLQLDSCVRTHVGFEVMIAPTPARGPSDESAPETARPEALYLTLTQDPRWAPVTYLTYLGVAIQPLSLRVEQNTVCRLIRLVDTLNREWQRLEARLQPLQVTLMAADDQPGMQVLTTAHAPHSNCDRSSCRRRRRAAQVTLAQAFQTAPKTARPPPSRPQPRPTQVKLARARWTPQPHWRPRWRQKRRVAVGVAPRQAARQSPQRRCMQVLTTARQSPQRRC